MKAKLEPECPWIVARGGFQVIETGAAFHVLQPSKSGTHAESDSSYAKDLDGLSIAIARMFYLVKARTGETVEGGTAYAVDLARAAWKES